LNFSIYPYKNEWKDEAIYQNFDRRKQLFYKGFYIRFDYFNNNISTMANNFREVINMGFGLLRYLWWDKRFVISGLKGVTDK
jgi:hypothetical protein